MKFIFTNILPPAEQAPPTTQIAALPCTLISEILKYCPRALLLRVSGPPDSDPDFFFPELVDVTANSQNAQTVMELPRVNSMRVVQV
jgi:hypothetical protein